MVLQYIAGPVIGAAIGYFTNFIAVKMLFHPKKEVKVFGHRLPFTPGAIPKGKSRLAKSVGDAVGKNLITKEDIENKLLSDELAEKISDAIIGQLSVPIKDIISDMSENDIAEKKSAISKGLSEYIAEAVSKVDLSAIIAEKAPGVIKEKLNNPMIEMFLTEELLQAVLAPVGTEIQKYIAEHGSEYIEPYVSEKLENAEENSVSDIAEKLSIDREQLKKAMIDMYKKAVSGCSDKLMEWLDLGSIVEDKINAMSADELEKLVMSVMKKELNTIVNLGALIGLVLGVLNIFI